MAATLLPSAPNLEYYRKQAKALLNSCKSGDFASLNRIRTILPQMDAGSLALNDAQWIIAREHGFQSWSKFKAHIELAAAAPVVSSLVRANGNGTDSLPTPDA